jgi:ABC-type transport system involved in cytochrome bd biosynthesis, ATPase and permease components
MGRILNFLKEEEVEVWASALKLSSEERPFMPETPLAFKAASFEWYGTSKTEGAPNPFKLGPLDVTFPPGKLTLISGATGSGKSALLIALLGGKSRLSSISFIPADRV